MSSVGKSPDHDLRPYKPMDGSGLLRPETDVVLAAKVAHESKVRAARQRRWLGTLSAVTLLLCVAVGSLLLRPATSKTTGSTNSAANKQEDNIKLQVSKVGGTTNQLATGGVSQLAIQGQLKVTNSVVFAPSSQPTAPTAGQLYYNQQTNNLEYYNGSEFVSLTPAPLPEHVTSIGGSGGVVSLGSSLVLTNGTLDVASSVLQAANNAPATTTAGVTSFQGLTGAVSLNAGSGIAVNGTTITNTGIISLLAGTGIGVTGNTITNNGVVSLTSSDGSVTITPIGNGGYNLQSAGGGAGVTSFGGATGVITLGSGLGMAGNALNNTGILSLQAGSGISVSGNTITNTGITSLVAGSGIGVVGNTVSNNGVTSLGGTPNQVAVSSSTGGITLSLPQNIDSSATPSFGGETLAGNLDITGGGATIVGTLELSSLNAAGVLHTDANGNISTSKVVLGSETTGNYVANFGSLTGLSTTGNSGAGSTPTLAVVYGSGANEAAAGSNTFNCPAISGTNLTGGGGSITVGVNGSSCNGIGFTNSPSFSGTVTIASDNSLTLGTASSKTGSIILNNSSNGNTITLQAGATNGTGGSVVFTLPTADGGSGQCLDTDGNGNLGFTDCSGGGGGGGSGINNQTAVQTAANYFIKGTNNSVTATIQGANGGGNIVNLYGSSSSSTVLASIDAGGNFLTAGGLDVQTAGTLTVGGNTATELVLGNTASTNSVAVKTNGTSHTAFSIQDANGFSILNADSVSDSINIGGPAIHLPGQGSFSSTTYASSSVPEFVNTGDFNHDGHTDTVVLNADGSLSVYMNNGDGTFGAPVNYPVGAVGVAPAVADFNGDNYDDIAYTDSTTGDVMVMMNNGDGTFGAPVDYPVDGDTEAMVFAADVNHDGSPDLIVSDPQNNQVFVLMNNGDGTFAAPVAYSVPAGIYMITVADVNHDGYPDIVATDGDGIINSGTGLVSVLLNNGDGTFAPPVTYAGGYGALSITMGDLNGDGYPDIVMSDTQAGNDDVEVLLNNGDGTFGAGTFYNVGTTPYLSSIADVNGDGYPDIVVALPFTGQMGVLLNNGDGTFGAVSTSPLGTEPIDIVPINLNGDSHLDFVATDAAAGMIALINNFVSGGSPTLSVTAVNSGTGALYLQAASGQSAPIFIVQSAAGSAYLEVAATGNLGVTGSIDTISSGGTISLGSGNAAEINVGGSQTSQIAIGTSATTDVGVNLDRTGGTFGINSVQGASSVNVLSEDASQGRLSVGYDNNQITAYNLTLFTQGSSYKTPLLSVITTASGDINGDGKPDMVTLSEGVVGSTMTSDASVYTNDGSGNFTLAHTYTISTTNYVHDLTVADVNGDGYADIVYDVGSTIYVMLNNGDGTFAAGTPYADAPDGVLHIAVGDVNDDGHPDILFTTSDDNLYVMLNNGNGTFGAATTYNYAGYAGSITVADLNGDGYGDVVMGDASGTFVYVLMNNGDGTFGAATNYQYSSSFGGNEQDNIAVADVNGDGYPDIVATNVTDGVYVMLNNGDGTFGAATLYTTGLGAPYNLTPLVMDINGDGKPDIVVTSNEFNQLSILTNVGNGQFVDTFQDPQNPSQPAIISYGSAGTDFHGGALSADLNGDGKLDIVLSDSLTNSVITLVNNGQGVSSGAAVSITAGGLSGSADGGLYIQGSSSTKGALLLVQNDSADVPLFSVDSSGNVKVKGDIDTTAQSAPLTIGVANASTITVGGASTGAIGLNGSSVNLKSNANSTAAVTMQDATGFSLFNADTSNERINIGGAQVASGTFNEHDYADGDNYVISTADLNGDGKPDIVTAGGGSIHVMLNNGYGQYGSPVNIDPSDTSVTFPLVADVNGDGKPDILLDDIVGGVHQLQIFFNNGNGTFASPVDYPDGGSLGSPITVTDLNGDGHPDIIFQSAASGYGVLMNNGNNTFASPVFYSFSGFPGSTTQVSFTDVNGDGKADIVMAGTGTNDVGVMLNNGSGVFGSVTNYPTSSGFNDFAVKDVNNDGKVDIVGADHTGSNIEVLLGNGSGGFSASSSYNTGMTSISYLQIKDVNNDTKPDVVLCGNACSSIGVLLNNGSGVFSSHSVYSTGVVGEGLGNWGPYALTDINGDGYPDIVVEDLNSLRFLINNGDGTYAASADYPADNSSDIFDSSGNQTVAGTNGAGIVNVVDVNGDGHPDLIIPTVFPNASGTASSDGVSVFINDWNTRSGGLSSSVATVSVTATSATNGGLFIQGADGQTADLLVVQDASGDQFLKVDASGNLWVNGSTTIASQAAGNVALTLKAAASQTADILQVEDVNGGLLAKIDKSGNLTVKNGTFTGLLTISGHIISANSTGSTTAVAATGAGTGATANLTGNDTSGKIVITTGSGTAVGDLTDITFATAYGTAPNVVLTAGDGGASKLQYYVTCTTTGFSINVPTGGSGLGNATTYTLYYHVIQ